MKYALINGDRAEATKEAKGFCPCCGSELIAKCGEVKVHYWAHKGKRNCDTWWENETVWHRSWKDKFPTDWQEIVHFDESGEKHIADVKTNEGWALEFQHSFLNPKERRSRNTFYSKLVWIVDGTRRKTDKPNFFETINRSRVIWKEPYIIRVNFPEECRLLKEWNNSDALVFFDFQESDGTEQIKLFFLFPNMSNYALLAVIPREQFIEFHNNNKFDDLANNTIFPIREILTNEWGC